MTHSEEFFGRWSVEIVGHDAKRTERVWLRLPGARNIELPSVIGTRFDVDKWRFSIDAQWKMPGATSWNRSELQRSASYTLKDGLVVTLGIDAGDQNFANLVLRCVHTDPESTPWRPVTIPFDFTVPGHTQPRRATPPRPDATR